MGVYADREGIIALKNEVTYGTDPTPTIASDALYVEEFSMGAVRTSLPRRGPSPYEHGFMPVAGPPEVSASCRFELTPQAMTAGGAVLGDIDAGLDAGLRMGGLEPVAS
ncbi:MAG: hypothetical protein R3324_16965, partial [Halobacteriales archaeon]|nr:hypothetical protein [Halobacteriales archaeon]